MAEIGERVAVVETEIRTQGAEIDSLRDTRHEHAAWLQRHELQIETNEKAVDVITNRVVPEIQATLEKHAADIRRTRETEIKSKSDFGWVIRILAFILLVIVAVGEGVVVAQLGRLLERPVLAAPAPIAKHP